MAVPPDDLVTTQVNVVLPETPAASLAEIVTDDCPTVDGLPVINPVEAPIDRPAGNPLDRNVNADPAESVATT